MIGIKILGHINLSVQGMAPSGLQNIDGLNWPNPPMGVDKVSYVYVAGEELVVELASRNNARFRQELVREDNERSPFSSLLTLQIKNLHCSFCSPARLIYHENNMQSSFGDSILCAVALETTVDETRWIHLIHLPSLANRL
jgi:hypothetical protein